MSLAQSILEYIHDKVKAKTLFSTHYHELTVLEKNLRYLKNIHVSAKEENGTITFLHKVKPGAVDKSYGIHVASLVNLPKEIITRASEILDLYENKNKYLNQLSKGMLQKILIIQAFIGEPDVLIFDEALNGLDIVMQKKLIELIGKEKNKDKELYSTIPYARNIIHEGKECYVEVSPNYSERRIRYFFREFK